MKRVIRHAARSDILRQYRFYAVDQGMPEVGERFLEAVEQTIAKLLAAPGIGAPKRISDTSLQGLRSWQIEGFENLRIYYQVKRETFRVIRLLHSKRDIDRILGG